MFEIFKNFVKNLETLDDYCVLKKERENIIVGFEKKILEHQKFEQSLFQGRSDNVMREFPIFFLITIGRNKTETEKTFKKYGFPILSIEKFGRKEGWGVVLKKIGTSPYNSYRSTFPLNEDTAKEDIEKIISTFVFYNFCYG